MADEAFIRVKKRLQDFQVARLKETYRDFLVESEKFYSMCVFFTDHLYGSDDKSARNESFFKLIHSFERILGKEILHSVSLLVEAHDLSEELDDEIVVWLIDRGRGDDLDMEIYEEAYRDVDSYEPRVRQIELLVESLHVVHRIASYPFMGMLLKTLYAGAVLVGATPMVDFLQDGYDAMRSVRDPTPFTGAIRERELARLDRIYGVSG